MFDSSLESQFVLWDARPGEIINYQGRNHMVGATWPDYVVFYESTDEIVHSGTRFVQLPCFAVHYKTLKASGAYYVTRTTVLRPPLAVRLQEFESGESIRVSETKSAFADSFSM